MFQKLCDLSWWLEDNLFPEELAVVEAMIATVTAAVVFVPAYILINWVFGTG